MATRASCKTCDSRNRAEIEASRAAGASFATLARNYGGAEATIRRHFRLGHARPAAKPAPAPVARPAAVAAPAQRHPRPEDPDPEVSFAKVRRAAEYLAVPVGELAACLENHLEVHVATANAAEEEELFAAWDAADDCDEYCQAVIRTGKFLEETAQ